MYAYVSSDLMHRTAMAISGLEVTSLPVLDQLPEVIRDDIECDFDGDDDTPAIATIPLNDTEETP